MVPSLTMLFPCVSKLTQVPVDPTGPDALSKDHDDHHEGSREARRLIVRYMAVIDRAEICNQLLMPYLRALVC